MRQNFFLFSRLTHSVWSTLLSMNWLKLVSLHSSFSRRILFIYLCFFCGICDFSVRCFRRRHCHNRRCRRTPNKTVSLTLFLSFSLFSFFSSSATSAAAAVLFHRFLVIVCLVLSVIILVCVYYVFLWFVKKFTCTHERRRFNAVLRLQNTAEMKVLCDSPTHFDNMEQWMTPTDVSSFRFYFRLCVFLLSFCLDTLWFPLEHCRTCNTIYLLFIHINFLTLSLSSIHALQSTYEKSLHTFCLAEFMIYLRFFAVCLARLSVFGLFVSLDSRILVRAPRSTREKKTTTTRIHTVIQRSSVSSYA